jgi:DNA polymerase-1
MSFELPPVTLITSTNGLKKISQTLMHAPAIALDTETIRANTADTRPDPRRDRLRLIQLATPEQTYVIDCEKVFPGVLWDLFKRQDLTLIGHNIAFDLQALRSANAPWPDCNLIDTMLAVQVLGMGMEEPKESYSLGDVVDFFLGSPLDKSLQLSDWSGDLSEEQLRYAAVDTAILLPLWAEILPRLQRAELVKIAALEGNVAAGVAWMSWNGMKVDRQRWLAQADVQRVRRAALDVELNEMAGRTINWASAKAQVLPVLRARGLAIEKTDEDTLTPYVTDPVVSKLLERREAAVLAQTYGEKWLRHIHPDTGRVHPEFLQCNSRAGRMIANHPNLQNIPRHQSIYRTFFVADEGNILIKGDYDQIEMRLAALISGDERMIAAYQRGEDLHRLTASGLLDVPVEQITKQQRQLAKPVNFGLIYSMSAPGLQRYAYKDYRVEMTVEQAKAHRDRWFELYPGIADWQRRIDRNLRARGTLDTRTLMGRRRHSVDYPGAAYNSPVQGSAADGCKLALVQVYRQWHRSSNIKLVNMVHDELVLEVSANIVEDISHDLQQAMYEPMVEMVGGRIPIKVEITTGPTWGGG